jgi:hypothetical protein
MKIDVCTAVHMRAAESWLLLLPHAAIAKHQLRLATRDEHV